MEIALANILQRHGDRVRKVLNILLESPYFYMDDDHDSYLFLRRHRSEFAEFFKQFYGWTLQLDAKCARLYKAEWHNTAITPANRSLFSFTKRDECIAFMILLEFFEQQLEENGMTVEDRHNLRFHFGDLLNYSQKRFMEIFPARQAEYSQDRVREKIWKPVMPELEKYRFLKKIIPPEDIQTSVGELIYEALPALYHYNGATLSRMVPELAVIEEEQSDD